MYECLYGYTPFACENRQDTKLRILKHRSSLDFPDTPKNALPVSYSALDLMMCLLVEKEDRLSCRLYRHNDYVHRMLEKLAKSTGMDRHEKGYGTHFVYPNDAEDIKNHKFFRTIPWEELHVRRPPFVPRVRSCEDTKYFDDGDTFSDISDSSYDDDAVTTATRAQLDGVETIANGEGIISVNNSPGSRVSQHQYEDQKIIPSAGMQVMQGGEVVAGFGGNERLPNPLLNPDLDQEPGQIGGCSPARKRTSEEAPAPEKEVVTAQKMHKKRKEKKRPRDKILRDAQCASTAMEVRKKGAFLGYGYCRPNRASEVIQEVLIDVANERVVAEHTSKDIVQDPELRGS